MPQDQADTLDITLIPTLNTAWSQQIIDIWSYGDEISPREMLTREIPQRTLVFDMNYPVVTFKARKMGYKFMAAEAWWILSGRDDVESIAKYSKVISKFSDDGISFFGAYGPKVVGQLDYVVQKLIEDPDTRQAGLTMWRENPPQTKDVPCTIALWFQLRQGRLNCHVFMRSSDNWLGVPYDAFNFTMIACEVLRRLNEATGKRIMLGTCFFTAASSHLYERNFDDVQRIMDERTIGVPTTRPVPPYIYGIYDVDNPEKWYYPTIQYLNLLKDTGTDDSKFRWWVERNS